MRSGPSNIHDGGGESTPSAPVGDVAIPDYTLVRRIGHGSYGDVWLARSIMGAWRAIKIVRRHSRDDDAAFKREYAGLRRFEPISRAHEGYVGILHVGLNEVAGYFYYVMELADDHAGQSVIEPHSYQPKTLRSWIREKRRLPLPECIEIGLTLAQALDHLHRHGLVHRDIKPSNIIFIGGRPRLADIGLVTVADTTVSFVGTEGYVPPEGPGTARADLYGLGKLLYEISTGRDRHDYPEPSTDLISRPDHRLYLELNEVVNRACAHAISHRYRSASQLGGDLQKLKEGRSVRRFLFVKRHALRLAGGVLVLAGLAGIMLSGRLRNELPKPRVLAPPPMSRTESVKTLAPIREGVSRVSARGHTLAILPSGHLAAWGWNRYGQLGLGHTNDALRPALVGKATNWTAAEAGDDFSIGLQSDGSLWAWGNNAYGQLGTGGEARALIPTRLGGTTRWASIALGQHFVFARKQDGSLWGWGRNEKGQLGLATTGHVWKPIRLADPGVVWRQLTGNYEHSAGIKADGSLWTWGENSLGRLGRELPVPSRQPIPVTNGVWKEVSAGFAHCAALRDDGTLWSWGWNSHGQLGLGEVGTVVAPKQIGQDTDWRAVSAAAEHTLALKTDGSLWAWGSGMFGEIGDGARFDRRVPTRVGDETNWVSLPVVNGSASFAIKNDGSLWGWGLNRGGQLGDGTRESPAHPIRILPQP